jgi:hypothetical protein
MDIHVVPLSTIEQVRGFVRRTLCELRQGLVKRHGRPCGLFFQIQGPRLLRTYAVWAGDEHRILFYDSTGTRFAEARLCESPDPAKLAA